MAYRHLKLQLSKAPIMVPPNWAQPLHIFVDALDHAVGSVLMQEQTSSWFCPIYYASHRLFYFHVDHSALLYLVK